MPLDLVITGGYFPIDAYYNCSDFILDVRKLPTTGETYFIGFSSIWEQCSKEVISSLTSPGAYTSLEDWKSLEKELRKFVAYYILAPPKQKANKLFVVMKRILMMSTSRSK
jgi:hypothetical protein